MLAIFAGEIACELHVGGFGNRIGAQHGRALEAADRGDDGDRAVLALDHLRHHEADQPVIGDDVVVQNLAKLVIGNSGLRSVIGIRGGVADQRVDLAEHAVGFLDEMLQIILGRDVGGYRERDLLAGLVVDRLRHLVADLLLARRDHHFGAMLGHPFGDGAADAARGAGDDGDFSRHIKQGHVSLSQISIRRRTHRFSFLFRAKQRSRYQTTE